MGHTHHFVGCIPVRAGALVLSFMTMLITGAMGGVTWFEFIKRKPTGSTHIALIVTGAVFSAIAVVSLIGFLGSVAGSVVLVTIYSTALFLLLAVSLAAGTFLVVSLFINGGEGFVNACVENEDVIDQVLGDAANALSSGKANGVDLPSQLRDFCFKQLTVVKVILITVLVLAVLIQAYSAYVVRSYASQLAEDDEDRVGKQYGNSSPASSQAGIVINNSYSGQNGYGSSKAV